MAIRATTIMDVMKSVFPYGYVDHPRYLAELKRKTSRAKAPVATDPFANPPCAAPDLFALMGQLLLKSGAYHHVCPEVGSVSPSDMLLITKKQRAKWERAGRVWRGQKDEALPAPPPEVIDHWNSLMTYSALRVFRSPGFTDTAREWWEHAVALFCIADEAARDIGFRVKGKQSAQASFIELPIRLRSASSKTGVSALGPYSISRAASDVVCVLPKSRTARVGCTLRSLSHNLALLPGRGIAQARWSLEPQFTPPIDDGDPKPFNVVLLPYPFRIEAKAFRAFPADHGTWGWFDVDPHWCPRSLRGVEPHGFADFSAFIDDVLNKAANDVGTVHGLVLPEVALSEEVFRALCKHLQSRDGFELLVSGLFDGPTPRHPEKVRNGNFTGMARFVRGESQSGYDISIREKHHRWRLDRGQIEAYALGSALDINRGWWEHIDILQRSLDIFVIRGGATVTTLICEDLARNDPCQELVRAIGPNFVVALLMDGPQLKDRWPARYATVLADDPGSSVLSLTSLGLIHRGNLTAAYPEANQIALFRDDTGTATEIKLPKGAHGMCLTLQPTELIEHTLDGRADKGDAQSWRLSAVHPVTADEKKSKKFVTECWV